MTLTDIPARDFRHLRRLSDDIGIIQHAKYSTPDRHHGYCVDDNARALLLTVYDFERHGDGSVLELIDRYLAFVTHAFDPASQRFRNFMAYDRRWLEAYGSEDSHGRTLWALGVAIRHAPREDQRALATRLFLNALEATAEFTSPRAWAFTLLGLHEYAAVSGSDVVTNRLSSTLGARLYDQFRSNAEPDWLWCEDTVTYSNAILPLALVLTGSRGAREEIVSFGLEALAWLIEKQTAHEGHLSLIGNGGWMPRGSDPARFDQQPVDAMCLLVACAEAYRVTDELRWRDEALRTLEWFLGVNDVGMKMFDENTGGGFDGLEPKGVNRNQGAESTLAWLIARHVAEGLVLAENEGRTATV